MGRKKEGPPRTLRGILERPIMTFLRIRDMKTRLIMSIRKRRLTKTWGELIPHVKAGALLLEELVNSCGEGINAILEAAQRRFAESQLEKAAGSVFWWRISGSSRSDFGNLMEQILTEDIGTGVHEYPFLHARALSAVASFSSLISQRVLDQFLYAAMKTISLDVPAPVKVGACRALSSLLPEADKGILQPHIMNLFSSLMDLLKHASDETLHLILETLQAAVKAGDDAIVTIEPIISPMMLNMWASHVSDPFISIDAVEVLECPRQYRILDREVRYSKACDVLIWSGSPLHLGSEDGPLRTNPSLGHQAIRNAPGCIWPLISRVLPSIGPILEKPQQQPDGLVAGSLDLITMLLKVSITDDDSPNAPVDVVKAVFGVCFRPLIQIILESKDDGEMQNATECLAVFVSGGKQEMLAWGADSGSTMRSLLDAASRLLDPELESSGSLFVGSYILQLIVHMPLQMAQHIQDLVAALVRRMLSCQTEGLRSSLLLIIARLVHMSAPNVEQFIDLLIRLPAEGYENSLAFIMSEWTKQQGEIQGSYQIKVTTTALAILLSTRHAELAKIHVRGYLIRIMTLLADMLIEIKEQVLVGEDEVVFEDSDWEEVQGGDGDADKALLYSAGAPYGKPTNEHLDAMAKVFNENQDDSYEDDLLQRADPLNEINLANYIGDFVTKFSAVDRTLFNNLCKNLTPAQQSAIHTVLQ
ncbi:hypothetical protein IFM89_000475 [Coptis chinensis]|uniref:Importin-7/11-like TPR repeats domain-containing protein n=1 Tax=Coptis chinensis TaxID=261450 RepID=A0A835H0A5_9MAGN|nr:hypothetical protein IFM89_000475 [Coptis chinensis]